MHEMLAIVPGFWDACALLRIISRGSMEGTVSVIFFITNGNLPVFPRKKTCTKDSSFHFPGKRARRAVRTKIFL
jgi:hypothetical protein